MTVSSIEHKAGHLDFDDLQREKHYAPRAAYQQSKLANAALRGRARPPPARGGLAGDQRAGPPRLLGHQPAEHRADRRMKALLAVTNRLLAQNAKMGALPTLYAATAPGVDGGSYYGPDGLREARGHPTLSTSSPRAATQRWGGACGRSQRS